MKTTLITIITSLFFSACANNNPTDARRAANASFQEDRLARLREDQITSIRNNSAPFDTAQLDSARWFTRQINY